MAEVTFLSLILFTVISNEAQSRSVSISYLMPPVETHSCTRETDGSELCCYTVQNQDSKSSAPGSDKSPASPKQNDTSSSSVSPPFVSLPVSSIPGIAVRVYRYSSSGVCGLHIRNDYMKYKLMGKDVKTHDSYSSYDEYRYAKCNAEGFCVDNSSYKRCSSNREPYDLKKYFSLNERNRDNPFFLNVYAIDRKHLEKALSLGFLECETPRNNGRQPVKCEPNDSLNSPVATSRHKPYQVELATSWENRTEISNSGISVVDSSSGIKATNMTGDVLPSAQEEVTEEILNSGGIVKKKGSIEVYTPCKGSERSTRVIFQNLSNHMRKDSMWHQKNYKLQVDAKNHFEGGDVEIKIIRYGLMSMDFSRYNPPGNDKVIDYILCSNGYINLDDCTGLDKSYRRGRRKKERIFVPGKSNYMCEDIVHSFQSSCSLNQKASQGTSRRELVKSLVKDIPWVRLEQTRLKKNKSLEKTYPLGLDQYDPNFRLELRVTNLNNGKCKKKPLIINSFALKKHRTRRLPFGVVIVGMGYRALSSAHIDQIVKSLKEVGVERVRIALRGFYKIVKDSKGNKKWAREHTLAFLKALNRAGIKKIDLRIHSSIEDYLYEDRVYYRPWHRKSCKKYENHRKKYENCKKKKDSFSTLNVWKKKSPNLNSKPLVVKTMSHWNRGKMFSRCGHSNSSIRKININRYKSRLTKWLRAIKEQDIHVNLLGVFNEQNWTCFNADIITYSTTPPHSLNLLPVDEIRKQELKEQAREWQKATTKSYAKIVKATLEVRDSFDFYNLMVESFASSLSAKVVERMNSISRNPNTSMAGYIHTCAFVNEMKALNYKGKSVFDHLQAVSFNIYPAITETDDVRAETKSQLETVVQYLKRCTLDKPLSISEFGYPQKFRVSRNQSGDSKARSTRNSQQRYDSYRAFVELIQENKQWNIDRIFLFSWNMFRNPISIWVKKNQWLWEYPSEGVLPEAEIMRYSF